MLKLLGEYRSEFIILIIGFVLMNLIFLSDAFRSGDTIDTQSAGLFGDFVGGYVGTLFILLSSVLLFATLKNQRISGQEQNFEIKYFELVKMHRDNVAELELQGTKGRKIFVLILREYRSILDVTHKVSLYLNQELTRRQLIHVAYYCLFFGTGPNSSRMLKMSLSSFDKVFVDTLESELNQEALKKQVKDSKKLGFVPFEGHQSRLGHYYRHLYQTVCYVDKQKLSIDKYEYVKTIRAQLTTHEQALLLINSLTPIGNNWWDRKFIKDYRLVKNLPSEFFDSETEIQLNEYFDKGYFEWEKSNST